MLSVTQKAVGYVRVSTDIQVKEGHSIEAQKEKIFDYCKYKKLDFDRYYVDEGESGKDMHRQYLQEMLTNLVPGIVIVILSLSRLTRSVSDALELVHLIKHKKCSLVILDLDINTDTAQGDLMLNIMASVAQFERKNTAEKVSLTLNKKSKDGTLITKPKYGYKVIKEGTDHKCVVNDEEQAIISLIKEIILNEPKITVTNIIRILETKNIKIRKAKKLHHASISKIIRDNNMR